jgi:high-affinity Fe2+/Pb2+ permease
MATNTRTIGPVTTAAAAGTGVAGAAAIVLVWLLSLIGVDAPTEVSAAFAVLLAAVGSIVGGYLVRPTSEPGRHE